MQVGVNHDQAVSLGACAVGDRPNEGARPPRDQSCHAGAKRFALFKAISSTRSNIGSKEPMKDMTTHRQWLTAFVLIAPLVAAAAYFASRGEVELPMPRVMFRSLNEVGSSSSVAFLGPGPTP